jgi:arylsulfatase A-like enzyme
MPSPLNILWITTDQQRADTVRALGNDHIRTPNLDRLCAEGVAFTHAHCQSPICTPSRSSFLTGLYPSAVHANRNGSRYFPENERVRLITRRLADAGYDCGLSGKLHIAAAWDGEERRCDDGYRRFWFSHSPLQGLDHGNQYLAWLREIGRLEEAIDLSRWDASRQGGAKYRPDVPTELHQTAWCADRAIEFIQEGRTGPWLMSVNLFDPHPPFDAPDRYRNRYDEGSLPPPLYRESDVTHHERLSGFFFQSKVIRPDEDRLRKKASYYGMVELIDEQVGRMLDALEASGQRERTVVLFASDHGEMLGDHGVIGKGCRFYEALVRVPLIISGPGFRKGLLSDALVELTDLAPTLADVAGLELPWTHGTSLVPLLTGEQDPSHHRDFVRCEYYDTLNMFAPHEPERHTPCWATMYRDRRYKLATYHGSQYGELYDLDEDPNEFDNLWEQPEHQALKHELIKKSFDATVVIGDPGPPRIGRF